MKIINGILLFFGAQLSLLLIYSFTLMDPADHEQVSPVYTAWILNVLIQLACIILIIVSFAFKQPKKVRILQSLHLVIILLFYYLMFVAPIHHFDVAIP